MKKKKTTSKSNKKPCTKGIILAAGSGSRLYPMTKLTNKQLLPLYNKPVIYYPLATLMLAGIKDILIICTPQDLLKLTDFLQDGSQWNINLSFAIQKKPTGIPDAFIIAEEFIGNDPVALILGDNIFHGQGFSRVIQEIASDIQGAHLFAYTVSDPRRYGVVVLDKQNKPIAIEEKPNNPKSRHAVTGLYFYDNNVINITKNLRPSGRGELEITDVNNVYIEKQLATAHILTRGFAWFDVGTPEALAKASQYIQVVEERQDIGIACPEEIAWRMQWINNDELHNIILSIPDSQYKKYLSELLDECEQNGYQSSTLHSKIQKTDIC